MTTVTKLPPRIWKPTAAELRAIRAYCAEVEGKRPGAIVIEVGRRYNLDTATHRRGEDILSMNIHRVTDHPTWDDTDIDGTAYWRHFKEGVELDKRGRALCDFYIYTKRAGEFHGDLLGNAQVYVETREGRPRIVGFSATGRPYEAREVAP